MNENIAITIFFLFFRRHSFEVTFETMGSFQISIPPTKWRGKEYKWNRPLASRSLRETLHSSANTKTAYCEESWQCTLTIDDCAACSIWQYAVYGHLKTLNQSITLSELHFIHKTQYSCDRKAFLFFYKLRHSSDRSVLLDKLQQTKGRRKRAKRMMDWANVRMIKDGCV